MMQEPLLTLVRIPPRPGYPINSILLDTSHSQPWNKATTSNLSLEASRATSPVPTVGGRVVSLEEERNRCPNVIQPRKISRTSPDLRSGARIQSPIRHVTHCLQRMLHSPVMTSTTSPSLFLILRLGWKATRSPPKSP